VKKKAEELKPGDLVVALPGFDQKVIPAFVASVRFDDDQLNAVVTFQGQNGIATWSRGLEVEVVVGLLTPAQQHAEELLTMVRRAANLLSDHSFAPQLADDLRALLARIDPPKPPSAEELAEALAELVKYNEMNTMEKIAAKPAEHTARAVLERARQAGYLGRQG
jgi:hypothetical protein